jgi:hypothetical protein
MVTKTQVTLLGIKCDLCAVSVGSTMTSPEQVGWFRESIAKVGWVSDSTRDVDYCPSHAVRMIIK